MMFLFCLDTLSHDLCNLWEWQNLTSIKWHTTASPTTGWSHNLFLIASSQSLHHLWSWFSSNCRQGYSHGAESSGEWDLAIPYCNNPKSPREKCCLMFECFSELPGFPSVLYSHKFKTIHHCRHWHLDLLQPSSSSSYLPPSLSLSQKYLKLVCNWPWNTCPRFLFSPSEINLCPNNYSMWPFCTKFISCFVLLQYYFELHFGIHSNLKQ